MQLKLQYLFNAVEADQTSRSWRQCDLGFPVVEITSHEFLRCDARLETKL